MPEPYVALSLKAPHYNRNGIHLTGEEASAELEGMEVAAEQVPRSAKRVLGLGSRGSGLGFRVRE